MVTPISTGTVGSQVHPNLQLWDYVYQNHKDGWTTAAVDHELLKFQDTLTGGKTELNILVPMCGKTRVMLSLAEKGHRIVGIDWSKVAVKQFLEENGLAYSMQSRSVGGIAMPTYTASDKAITVYCGDFFAFKQHSLSDFDCVLDHGTMGSFESNNMERTTYADIISSFVKPGGRVLLSIFDYEHSEHPSMPFAVTEEDVVTLYSDHFVPPELLQELDGSKTVDIFEHNPRSFTGIRTWVSKLNRFSWKILLMVKHSSF